MSTEMASAVLAASAFFFCSGLLVVTSAISAHKLLWRDCALACIGIGLAIISGCVFAHVLVRMR